MSKKTQKDESRPRIRIHVHESGGFEVDEQSFFEATKDIRKKLATQPEFRKNLLEKIKVM